uniref:GATA-type domain-containing protein n=1 Tax=Gasterosteus aculeatus aculeatus TaxID=481459 RepID=A0AAQ4RHI7_GASAC|nr:GATA-type zinc finger protein 1 [Gasterosteus aculeatus aculeatus]XP_040043316.1 GATA-type zinc finger protein 1 [Gasterosteus aculeatus aculeatus]XP_040043318.1 GATA-type zinc finger protein 1 [Gasterosteus aculeatus aculeatus]XP_040043319.1 GATA-type zinc finger protein 1 [Gasterosteus aculeatus aculeatus]
MSTGPRRQAALVPGNQSPAGLDASTPALLYLFQEVSKLASPIHNGFLDTNPPSAWLHDPPGPGPLLVKKEGDDARLFSASSGSCQCSVSPYKQVKEESGGGSEVIALAEPHPKCNSPWKVLSMINLQCERILHPGDVESEQSLVLTTKSFHATDKASTPTADAADQGVGGGCVIRHECAVRPSLLRQDVPACVGLVEDEDDCSRAPSYQPQCRDVGFRVQSQTGENVATLTVDRQFEWNQVCKRGRVSSEQDILQAPFCENVLFQTPIRYAFLNAQLTFNSKEALDHNANLALTAEPLCESQLLPPEPVRPPSASASLLFGLTEKCQSLAKRDGKTTSSKPEGTRTAGEEKWPPVAQLKGPSYNGEANRSPSAPSTTEPRPLQKEEVKSPSIKTLRKQPHPRRSADIQDPDFQGVTFRMDTELDDSRGQCRLLITSKYSKELHKSARKPRPRTRMSQKSIKTSSSDEESYLTPSVSKGKACESCCTRKTPMWRDAEDGTPLCNACGIRYKKYRVRCVKCWHIPRKEGNSNSRCLKCGSLLRQTSAQRKHAA